MGFLFTHVHMEVLSNHNSTITASNAIIEGNNNHIYGDGNTIRGNNCHVYGNMNEVEGHNTVFEGTSFGGHRIMFQVTATEL